MPNDVEQLLRQLQTSDRVRAVAFDAVYNMDDEGAEQALRELPIPDDVKATLWDKRAAYSAPQPEATPLPAAASLGMLPPSTMQGDPQSMNGWKAEHAEVGRMVDEAEMMAEPLAPTLALKGLSAAVAAVPTRARAGQKFQQVMQAVGDKPVDIARTGDAALRISQLAERGGSMPKAIRDFLRRATDPSKGDITYKEARDFYSNISRLSADEAKRLTPVVRKELGDLRVALDQALAKTAASGGQERVYRAAMREYRIASRTRELAGQLAKWGAGAVGAGAALKAGQALLD